MFLNRFWKRVLFLSTFGIGLYFILSPKIFKNDCSTSVEMVKIHGSSMSEILIDHQEVKAEFFYYNCNKIERDHIVIIKKAEDQQQFLVKKILLIPGDTFYTRGFGKGFQIIVNGNILTTQSGRPYLFSSDSYRILKHFEDTNNGVVPEDQFLVFGTQKNGSYDSSQFGPIHKSEIVAKVQF